MVFIRHRVQISVSRPATLSESSFGFLQFLQENAVIVSQDRFQPHSIQFVIRRYSVRANEMSFNKVQTHSKWFWWWCSTLGINEFIRFYTILVSGLILVRQIGLLVDRYCETWTSSILSLHWRLWIWLLALFNAFIFNFLFCVIFRTLCTIPQFVL
jgi:hypothetical protein